MTWSAKRRWHLNGRILIDVTDLLDAAAGDDEMAAQMTREIHALADEINSALPDYECTFVHLDTRDYLAFVKRDPEEGAFWEADAEERRAIVEALKEADDDD